MKPHVVVLYCVAMLAGCKAISGWWDEPATEPVVVAPQPEPVTLPDGTVVTPPPQPPPVTKGDVVTQTGVSLLSALFPAAGALASVAVGLLKAKAKSGGEA